MGWIANALLVYGAWRIAYKQRHGLLCGAIGGFVWAWISIVTEQWDLLFIEIVLSSIQLFSWWKWGQTP